MARTVRHLRSLKLSKYTSAPRNINTGTSAMDACIRSSRLSASGVKCGAPSQHLKRQHEFGPAEAAAREAARRTDREHHRQPVHHLQLKIKMRAGVLGVAVKLANAGIGLERANEDLRPRPAHVETGRPQALEA